MWKIRKYSLQSGLKLMTTRMIDEVLIPTEPQRLALIVKYGEEHNGLIHPYELFSIKNYDSIVKTVFMCMA